MPFAASKFRNTTPKAPKREIKWWELDHNSNLSPSVGDSWMSLDMGEGNVAETLLLHPTASNLLAVGTGEGAFVFDVHQKKKALQVRGMRDKVLSGSWSGNGALLALGDKSRAVAVFDPRAGSQPTMTRYREVFLFDLRNMDTPYHTQQFDTSTGILMPLYDPDTNLVYFAGKGSNKIAICEVNQKAPHLTDVFSYSSPEQTLGACLVPKQALDVMKGEVDVLLQLTKNTIFPISCIVPRKTYRDFLPDLFPNTRSGTAGCESTEWLSGSNNLPPLFSLDPANRKIVLPSETNNAAPKPNPPSTNHHSHSNTNGTTVNTDKADTNGVFTFVSTQETVEKISKSTEEPMQTEADESVLSGKDNKDTGIKHRGERHFVPQSRSPDTTTSPEKPGFLKAKTPPSPIIDSHQEPHFHPQQKTVRIPTQPAKVSQSPFLKKSKEDEAETGKGGGEEGRGGVKLRNNLDLPRPTSKAPVRPVSIIGPTSKFRHLVGTPGLKEQSFINIRNVNTRLPLESNGFCVSKNWAAVPIAGPGGLVAILKLEKPGKVADGVIPGLENHSGITDLMWCPFDDNELAVGCDNGCVKIWRIPPEGIPDLLHGFQCEIEERNLKLLHNENEAHEGRVLAVRYHPVCKDILLSAGTDRNVFIWDLSAEVPVKKLTLNGHSEPLLSVTWSVDGAKLVTASKDGMVRIFHPQTSDSPIVEKKILDSTRGARLVYCCGDRMLALVSFSKSSDRQMSLHESESLELLYTMIVDPSPQLLIPHYDYDSSVLFLTGKGDRMIQMYEVIPQSPWLMKLATHMCSTSHQAISFHQKKVCDVAKVEFARCWRLTASAVESLSFTVPRVKKDMFQNDLFPEALIQWESTGSCAEWFSGSTFLPRFRSLRPSNMDNLYPVNGTPTSETVSNGVSAAKRHEGDNSSSRVVDKMGTRNMNVKEVSKTGLMAAIGDEMLMRDDGRGLEQEHMEGVEEEEWTEEA